MLRHLLAEYVLRRLSGSSRHGRRSRYGYGPALGRHHSGWGRPRSRRRSRVHVTGCCLPIPLGVLMTLGLAGRVALRRR